MNTTEGHEHVGQAVRDRRLQMGESAAALAQRAEVDVKTLRSLESGDRWPRENSRAKIEAALRWKQGALEVLLRGSATEDQVLDDPSALSGRASLYHPTAAPVWDLRRIGMILGLDTEHLEAISDAEARPFLAELTLAYHRSGLGEKADTSRRSEVEESR